MPLEDSSFLSESSSEESEVAAAPAASEAVDELSASVEEAEASDPVACQCLVFSFLQRLM
jgi:hypothetical protein